jgi:hypothetical protein
MAIKDKPNRNGAWYALRRTLPPWRWRENLDELKAACRQYELDEVIVKIDTGTFTHYQPSFEWLNDYQKILFAIRDELTDIGVVYSLNPNVTLGHGDRGRNLKVSHPGVGFLVGHDGKECTDCACPLSEGWRKYIAKQWRIYAETKPSVIWVEDDIRLFNHFPVTYGCFCENHLAGFSSRIGETVTREKLVTALLAPGKPHPLRAQWLDFIGESMVDVAGILENAVHSVSSGTHLGLMSSGPQNHCVEGRRWQDFSAALAGGKTLLSRPPLGSYQEAGLLPLAYTARSIQLTRHVLPEKTVEMTEVENYPYTQYHKSAAFTFFQTVVSVALGCDGVTFNIFDHCGTPMSETPGLLEALGQGKPYLRALAKKCFPRGTLRGVGLLHQEKASYEKRLKEGESHSELACDSYGWLQPLNAMGFAATFEEEDVVALSGQAVRCLPEDKIRQLLSRGLLCDLSAAQTLQDLGYGKYLGVEVRRIMPIYAEPLAAEHLTHPDFGGSGQRYFSLAPHPKTMTVGEVALQPGAIELSRIIDPDLKRLYPGMSLFENELGGRVAVYPFDMNCAGPVYQHPARQKHLSLVLAWLRQKPLPLFANTPYAAFPFRMDNEDTTVIGVFCLSHDAWERVPLEMGAEGKTVVGAEYLAPEGEWKKFADFQQEGDVVTLDYDMPVDYRKPMIICVKWRQD